MAFRFRKSFKIMPGVKLNVSKSGFSTTVGGRGASVNIGKKGAYLNASIPGTGISSRSKIGGSGSGRNTNYSNAATSIPQDPQPANKGWYSFGVALFSFFTLVSLASFINSISAKTDWSLLGGAFFWAAVTAIWWAVRGARRKAKQAKYEAFIKKQADEAEALQMLIEQGIREKEEKLERQRIELREAEAKKQELRRSEIQQVLAPAYTLYVEGLISKEQLATWQKRADDEKYGFIVLELEVNRLARELYAEKARVDMIKTKYDEATACQLIAHQIIIGMSHEQVIDAFGKPTKVEKVSVNGKERETLVYGSKTTGSYFHIHAGIVTKAVIR
ncbi:DUF4236 domain-containing protein [Hymenobacter lapidiphilus]|uniref:DUF4236 domain-containing protein n=1 Tax=Hymenobacter sp. CCM 8763 TaxID=2303334 RepID=UPI000E34539E|nr:DUF4236 domain-containing protein [Hymenobacter sp. CCM 8763]RFP65899.1 DUF4236 domain-containing protein [Hymenobacter sp. CCM 8763]